MGCSGVLRRLETYKVRHVCSYVIYRGWKNAKGVSMSLTRGLKPPGGAVDRLKTMTWANPDLPLKGNMEIWTQKLRKPLWWKLVALFSGWGQYNIHNECFKFSLYKAGWVGMVTHSCNHGPWEVEAGSGVCSKTEWVSRWKRTHVWWSWSPQSCLTAAKALVKATSRRICQLPPHGWSIIMLPARTQRENLGLKREDACA